MTTKHLTFNKETDGCWYIDLPNWPFSHHNLMMVAGADDMCAFLSDDDKSVSVEVVPSDTAKENMTDYAELVKVNSSLTGGATYDVHNLNGFDKQVWICPVTLFVLHEYPKYIYVKKE